MRPRIDPDQFRRAYRQAVREIEVYITPECQAVIARHNLGLHQDLYDMHRYLEASDRRYLNAVHRFNQHCTAAPGETSALDVGGFLGAFPLALARVGVRVTLVEEYGYYHGAFDDLKAFLEHEGVEVWEADFTQALPDAPERRFTLVTNMAMLEHLPSSPMRMMDNLHRCLADRGTLILEAPNIAYWPNRLRALRGESIHQAFDVYYASEPPFMGHHREYTITELRDLLTWSGFAIQDVDVYNYSLSLGQGGWLDRLYVLAVYLWPTLLFRACREVIMATATATATATARPGGPAGPAALRLLGSA